MPADGQDSLPVNPPLAARFDGAPLPVLCDLSPQLLLCTQIGEEERSFLLQPGVTVGRSADNAICVDHCDLMPVHARVLRDGGRMYISACDPRWWLTLPSGSDTRTIELADGVSFRIGAAAFRCASARVMMIPVDDAALRHVLPAATPESAIDDDDDRDDDLPEHLISCVRCSQILLFIPPTGEFCPRCGARLPKSTLPTTEARAEPAGALPHPPTLVAYVNAMLNLAHRFELGQDGERNPAQALRYYRKAAKLGNRMARFRVMFRESGPFIS
jgi:Sel1 repeat